MRPISAALRSDGEHRRPHVFVALAVLAATAALLLAAPAGAQEPDDPRPAEPEAAPDADTAADAHQVVRGNTLWDLAASFYGNPYLWPRIWDANRDRIDDPHWIYPGQVLRIPDAEGRLVEVRVAAPGEEPLERDMRFRPADQERADDRTVFYRDGRDRQAGTTLPRTAFYPRERGAVDLVVDVERRLRLPVSHSSFYSAEWLVPERRSGAVDAVGRVVGFTGSEGTRSERVTARPIEVLQVALESGSGVTVGDLLQSYRPVRTDDAGTILRPSGVLVVSRLTSAGAEATISATFTPIQLDDLVRPAPPFALEPGMEAEPVESGLTARIIEVGDVRAIYGPRDVLILDQGADAGIRLGDEFVLVTDQPGFTDRVEGRARIVGVRAGTSSARIFDVDYPVFEIGRELRLDRRIP